MLDPLPVFDPDIAGPVRRAATLAEQAGEPARAAEAWSLAARQWRGLHRDADAEAAEAAALRTRSGPPDG